MKKNCILIILTISFVSCLKSGNRNLGPDKSPNGSIEFMLNNYPYEFTGGYNDIITSGIGVYSRKQLKSATIPSTRYTINGQLGAGKTINIVIITDSLKAGSYTTSSFANGPTYVKIDSIQYSNHRAVDFLSVNISKNTAGIIAGTFSGKLSVSKTLNGSITYTDGLITNGVFENVVTRY